MIAAGLAGLFFGGEWLVKGSSRLARSFGISALIIGLTIVAIGTSMPELIVSTDAALRGSSDISVGNVIGSNIANIGLILGIAGLISPMVVKTSLVRREIPIMVGVTLLLLLLVGDGTISQGDGLLLLVGMVAFISLLIYAEQRASQAEQALEAGVEAELEREIDGEVTPKQRPREALRVVLGIALLVVGARLTVDGAVALARGIGVSELVIGITLVAVGTSLPELATSVVAAFRGEADISIGNVVGSNIANILLILGVTSVISPVSVAPQIIRLDIWVALGFALVLFPFALNQKLTRWEAGVLLAVYVGYILVTFSGMVA